MHMLNILLNEIKGTVRVIVSDPPSTDSNTRLTMIPLKSCRRNGRLVTLKVFISVNFL